MKKRWFVLLIAATLACFATACGTVESDSTDKGNSYESLESSDEIPEESEEIPESSEESGVNGGVQEGDNDLSWESAQN